MLLKNRVFQTVLKVILPRTLFLLLMLNTLCLINSLWSLSCFNNTLAFALNRSFVLGGKVLHVSKKRSDENAMILWKKWNGCNIA
jgi:hypothetical protein